MRYRYVGLAEEASHGTAAAATAVIDPESTSLDTAEDQALVFTGVSGLQRQASAGPYNIEGDLSALLDDVVSGWLFKWLLGQYTTVGTAVGGGLNTTLSAGVAAGETELPLGAVLNAGANDYVQVGTGDTAEVHRIAAVGAGTVTLATALRFDHNLGEAVVEVTSPYTHTFSYDGRPVLHPFTVRVGKDLFEHVFAGCILSELEISVEDTFAKVAAAIMASLDAKAPLPSSITYTEGKVFPPHQVTVQLNNVDESARVEQATITISNGGELGRPVGSRFANRGYRGEFSATGELTLAFTDLQELERYWGSANGPANTLNELPVTISFGSGLDIIFPRVIYQNVGQPLEGPERIRQTVQFTALLDDAGTGPVQVVLVNNQPQYGG